ncbi:MAG: DcrB family lipoprotein [Candidatus Malihini olakiniferum]
MPKLVKHLGITLLSALLAACDGKKNDNNAAEHAASQNMSITESASQSISLLSGNIKFTLPADMHDKSRKVGSQSNNMHVYANDDGQRAVIMILGDSSNENLPVLAQRLEDHQRARDANLQVLTNKSIEINGHVLQQLDSISNSGSSGNQVYSSLLLGKVANQLLTMQITLLADNQQLAKSEAANIIHTLTLK